VPPAGLCGPVKALDRHDSVLGLPQVENPFEETPTVRHSKLSAMDGHLRRSFSSEVLDDCDLNRVAKPWRLVGRISDASPGMAPQQPRPGDQSMYQRHLWVV
jgi:hypothetical protein